jgi:prophage antirepressor-like protein
MEHNDNTFFLDIFNQLLKINENEIFIIYDIDENIWFKYKDLLKALGYSDIDHTINEMKIFDENKSYYKSINKTCTGVNPSAKIKHNTLFINEPGLYQVLSKSNKNIAKIFMDKYYQEIMPQIRKHGKYEVSRKDKQKLDKVNEKLDNYKQELTYYYDKYEFEPSKNGYLYINQNNSIKDGKEIKCFKIGYASDMTERLSGYKVGNFSSIAFAMRTAHIMLNK